MVSKFFIQIACLVFLGAVTFYFVILLERFRWHKCCSAVERSGGLVFWSNQIPGNTNSEHRIFSYPTYVLYGSAFKGSDDFRSTHLRVLSRLGTLEHITISDLEVDAQDLEFVLNSCSLVRKVSLIVCRGLKEKENYLRQKFPKVLFTFEND